MLITDLFKGVETGTLPQGMEITGIAVDSREVKPGDIFFAFSGAITDGYLYIAEAVSRGARAVVVSNGGVDMEGGRLPFITTPDISAALAACVNTFYKRPSANMEVIGVTGTNGKTTTSCLIAGILTAEGEVLHIYKGMGLVADVFNADIYFLAHIPAKIDWSEVRAPRPVVATTARSL